MSDVGRLQIEISGPTLEKKIAELIDAAGYTYRSAAPDVCGYIYLRETRAGWFGLTYTEQTYVAKFELHGGDVIFRCTEEWLPKLKPLFQEILEKLQLRGKVVTDPIRPLQIATNYYD